MALTEQEEHYILQNIAEISQTVKKIDQQHSEIYKQSIELNIQIPKLMIDMDQLHTKMRNHTEAVDLRISPIEKLIEQIQGGRKIALLVWKGAAAVLAVVAAASGWKYFELMQKFSEALK